MGEFKSDDYLSDELRKSIEISNKIKQTMPPEQRLASIARTYKNMAAINSVMPPVQLEYPLADVIDNLEKSIGLTAIKMLSYHIDTSAFQFANSISSILLSSVTTSIQNVLTNFSSSVMKTISSPLVNWLREIDFSPLIRIWENWHFDSVLADKYDELNDIYLRAMYDAKWFPYVGWIADVKLFAEVNEILGSSRGMSKRCENRINKAIISYYTKAEIKNIKRRWMKSDLEQYLKKGLGQTLEAYLRKEYALVIPFLATMWEGILKLKGVENIKKPKEDIKELVDENGYDDVFSDFYNNMIIGPCYSIDDVIEGVPNRHGVAHSWYKKYPNQKAALNAILLTDFLISLKPKKATENNMNLYRNEQEGMNNG